MLHLRNNFFLHPFKTTHHLKTSEWWIWLQIAWWNAHDYFSQRLGKSPLHLKFACTSAIYGSACPLDMVCLISLDDQPQMPVCLSSTFLIFSVNNKSASCLDVFYLDLHNYRILLTPKANWRNILPSPTKWKMNSKSGIYMDYAVLEILEIQF